MLLWLASAQSRSSRTKIVNARLVIDSHYSYLGWRGSGMDSSPASYNTTDTFGESLSDCKMPQRSTFIWYEPDLRAAVAVRYCTQASGKPQYGTPSIAHLQGSPKKSSQLILLQSLFVGGYYGQSTKCRRHAETGRLAY